MSDSKLPFMVIKLKTLFPKSTKTITLTFSFEGAIYRIHNKQGAVPHLPSTSSLNKHLQYFSTLLSSLRLFSAYFRSTQTYSLLSFLQSFFQFFFNLFFYFFPLSTLLLFTHSLFCYFDNVPIDHREFVHFRLAFRIFLWLHE